MLWRAYALFLCEKLHRLFNRQRHNFLYVFPVVGVAQCGGVVAPPLTFLAQNHNRLRKGHFIGNFAFPLADRASTLGIKAEPLGPHTVLFGEQLPYLVHNARISGGGGADRCADGLLVNYNRLWIAFYKFMADQ